MLCSHWSLDRATVSGAGYPDMEIRVERTWTPEIILKSHESAESNGKTKAGYEITVAPVRLILGR
jgi:hypothetical protein